jgi:PPE-repeat protein
VPLALQGLNLGLGNIGSLNLGSGNTGDTNLGSGNIGNSNLGLGNIGNPNAGSGNRNFIFRILHGSVRRVMAIALSKTRKFRRR